MYTTVSVFQFFSFLLQATLALNWQEDSAVKIQKVILKPLTRIVRLVFIITLTLHDIGFAIYVRLEISHF